MFKFLPKATLDEGQPQHHAPWPQTDRMYPWVILATYNKLPGQVNQSLQPEAGFVSLSNTIPAPRTVPDTQQVMKDEYSRTA